MTKPTGPAGLQAGPTVQAAGPLLDWLQGHAAHLRADGTRRRIRLPVVVTFSDAYRLEYGPCYIGVSDTHPPDGERVFVRLDDTGMGHALLPILARECPKERQWCAFWVEGYWGPLTTIGIPEYDGFDGERWPLAVLRLVGPVRDGDDARVYAEPD